MVGEGCEDNRVLGRREGWIEGCADEVVGGCIQANWRPNNDAMGQAGLQRIRKGPRLVPTGRYGQERPRAGSRWMRGEAWCKDRRKGIAATVSRETTCARAIEYMTEKGGGGTVMARSRQPISTRGSHSRAPVRPSDAWRAFGPTSNPCSYWQPSDTRGW